MSNLLARIALAKKSVEWWAEESDSLLKKLCSEKNEKKRVRIEKKLAFLHKRGTFELRVLTNLINELENE